MCRLMNELETTVNIICIPIMAANRMLETKPGHACRCRCCESTEGCAAGRPEWGQGQAPAPRDTLLAGVTRPGVCTACSDQWLQPLTGPFGVERLCQPGDQTYDHQDVQRLVWFELVIYQGENEADYQADKGPDQVSLNTPNVGDSPHARTPPSQSQQPLLHCPATAREPPRAGTSCRQATFGEQRANAPRSPSARSAGYSAYPSSSSREPISSSSPFEYS